MKKSERAWLRRFETEPRRAEHAAAPAPSEPAAPTFTLTPDEHLRGLWVALGLGDEEAPTGAEEALAASAKS